MSALLFSGLSGAPAYAQVKDLEEMVRAATLAPSGHNAQPWKFKVYPTCIEIYPDFTRALPVVDPNNRELYICLGCAAENLILAANNMGYAADFSVEATSRDCYYIRIVLNRDETFPDELFNEIPRRQTNRSLFSGIEIPDEAMDRIMGEIRYPGTGAYAISRKSSEFMDITRLVQEGNVIQMSDVLFKEELLEWIRFNKQQKQKHADGLSYDVMGIPAVPAVIGRKMLHLFLKPGMQSKTDLKKLQASSHLVLFTVSEDHPKYWILLGRNLERFLLTASEQGVSCAFNNQPCEVPELMHKVQEVTNTGPEIPVLLLRLGYAGPVAYAPRISPGAVVEFNLP